MASSRRTYDTDVITLRTVFAKNPGNSNVPALRTLTADGQGGTFWAIPSTLGALPSFNQIITSGGTYTADLPYNTFRLTAAENIGMTDGPPGSNQTYLYAKAFSQFDVSGENSIFAFTNNQLDSSVTFAGQGGIQVKADPATNTLFIVGATSNAYTISTGIYGFNQIKVVDAASSITSSIQAWTGSYLTATSPSTLLNFIGYNDIQMSTNVTTNSVFFTISTFTSKGYLDISANAYGAYPSTLSTVSSLYVQTPVFQSTVSYLSSVTGAGVSSFNSTFYYYVISSGNAFYNLTGIVNSKADISQLISYSNDIIQEMFSTTAGLGTLGYISTGGGGVIGSQQLISTVEGLGSAGYLSTAGGGSGDVTKANLVSTVEGLGTIGYVSSLSTITTSSIFNTGAISTYSLEVFGSATLTNSGSTILRGPVYIAGPTYIAGSFAGASNTVVTPSNLTSTVAGLGTSRYISSSQLQSTISNLGSLGYLSALRGFAVSTGNVTASSITLLDAFTNAANYLTVSSGSLLVNGAKISGGGGGGGNVAQIVAGAGISVTPAGGTGVVTIANTGATTTYVDTAISSFSTALGPVGSSYNFSTVSSVYGSTFVTNLLIASTMTTATILPSQSNLWITVGYGSSPTNSIQTSIDGLSWTDSFTGGFSTAGKGIAYNGSLWVSVGNNGGATGSIQYSGDGKNWSNCLTGGFSSGGNGVAYNGSLWIAVGNNGGSATTSIQVSSDGRNWSGITSGGFSVRGETVAWNGYYWVAVGQGATTLAGIQYSLDGRNWSSASSGGFATSGKGIAWNGSLWVAAGDDTTRPASLQYSGDGRNWSNCVSGGFLSAAWKVGWNGRMWVAVGDESSALKSIQTSIDGSNWSDIQSGGFSAGNDGYGVAWNGSLWIATGIGASATNSIQFSRDGLNWSPIASGGFTSGAVAVGFSSNLTPGYAQQNLTILSQNIPLFLTSTNQIMAQPSSLLLNTSLLVDTFYKRVGVNCNTPAYSLDVAGTGHFLTVSSLAIQISSINGVAYNDAGSITSTVGGLGNAGYVSTSGLVSTTYGLQTSGFLSTSALVSTTYGLQTSGFLSTSALVSTTYGLQTSGFLSTPVMVSTVAGLGQTYISSLNNVVTVSSLVLNVSSINGALPGTGSGNGSSLTVSTGVLYASSISFVNLNQTTSNLWVAVGANATQSVKYSGDGSNWSNAAGGQLFSFAAANTVAWNGKLWVAGGGDTTQNMKYSTDGINWLPAVGSKVFLNNNARGVAWNGSFWVAVGNDTTQCVKYSGDGSNWSNVPGSQVFSSNIGYGVAWNGTMWVAVGSDSTQNVKYSIDGMNWSNAAGSKVFALNIGRGVAWNGRLWIAVGDDTTQNVKYSYDGMNWSSPPLKVFGGGTGYAVAWNGSLWVAAGFDSIQSLKYSYDGINWSNAAGSQVFAQNVGRGVAWNGKLWVASGDDSTQSLKYSSDGINWSNAVSGGFTSAAYGIAYSSNVVPSYNQTNFEIEPQNIPVFLRSTNTMSFTQSSIITNNTLFVDTTNKVGINIGTPQTDLDVGGTGRFQTLSTLSMNLSSINGQTFGAPINSTVIGLGSAGYISTSALVSTTYGLQTSGFLSTSALVSTTYGLQTSGFLSTSALVSTTRGLQTSGFLSTTALVSTTFGLQTSGFLSTSVITSTVGGLGLRFATSSFTTSSITNVNISPALTYTIAVGSTGIYKSFDGITWSVNTATGTNLSDIGYNGFMWVYGGSGSATTSLQYSYDGVTWFQGSGGYTQFGNTVVWGGGIWVAGGINSPADANTLKYSLDGINWTTATNGFDNTCLGVAWNGYMFVAVGHTTNTIKYSYNGKTWINAASGVLGSYGQAIAWNGQMWVAGGQTFPTARYSYDGINWLSGSNTFGTATYGVAWNGQLWVAAGQGAVSLKYSTDGINWLDGTGSFSTYSLGASWNGKVWSAYGIGGATIKYSGDGINWSNASGSTFSGAGQKGFYYAGPAAYKQTNLLVLPDNVPNYATSTNQIFMTQSSIQLNNTLSIDGILKRVGINTSLPQSDLDVNGIIKASTVTIGTYTGFSTIGPAASNIRLALTQGDAYKPTGTSWSITSDQRIKENIVDADLDRCYSDVMSLKLRRFRYISSFIDATQAYDTRVLGFIAQEVSTIVPKAVSQGQGYGFDDLFTINVDQLQMSLFGAVKKTIQDKESMASTIKGQQITIETLVGSQTSILSTLNGLQGR